MRTLFSPTVIVVALGYFVDIFDLTLFNMIRIQSLKDLNVPSEKMVETSIYLMNFQMLGMLLGGVFWGVLGDKKGRLRVLFASIILYSLANFLNAFVENISLYAFLRFIAGVGLSGELGAGITLVAEILPKNKRGLGTTFVATVGVFGATFGALVVEYFSWSQCYIIGGVMGLLLLFLRVKMTDSEVFREQKKQSLEISDKFNQIKWGHFLSLFTNMKRFKKFYQTVFIGVPIWYIAGLVMAFSPELAHELGVQGIVKTSKSIGISYLGLGFGDLFCGLLSQKLQSRKKSILYFLLMTMVFLGLLFVGSRDKTPVWYYSLCFLIGFGAGFWAVFVTVAAEQFGTNLRATVTTSVPNFVRGSVIPMTLFFKFLNQNYSIRFSMLLVGGLVFFLALTSLYQLDETYHKDLKYFE